MTVSDERAAIASDLRQNAESLRSYMNSVVEQQREAMGMFGSGYGIERASRDALDCVFRVASSVIHLAEKTADALAHLPTTPMDTEKSNG